MAGQISQSESQVIYRRLAHVATQLLQINEEIERLDAARISLNLGTDLDPEQGGHLTKTQAVALFTELTKYRDWFENVTVAASGAEASNDRRGALDPFILAEPLI